MAISYKKSHGSAASVKHNASEQYGITLEDVQHFSALLLIKHLKENGNKMFTFTVEQSKQNWKPTEGLNKNPTVITLSGDLAKKIYDIVSTANPLKMRYDTLTLSKILLFLGIKSFYFRSIDKYTTDICFVGTDEEIESMKKQILDYEKRFSFQCPLKMVMIILAKMPSATVTTVIGCGGSTIVCLLDDAEYHEFYTHFMSISDFVKEIKYDPAVIDTKKIVAICNEINQKGSNVCHSVNKNKGTITLLAIELFDEIYEKIRHEVDLLTNKEVQNETDFFIDDSVQSVLPSGVYSDEVQSL
jgi:hypothetical protein